MLTLTHHINKHIGAYYYTLEGEVLDSEGNAVNVGEGAGKKITIDKALKFYSRANGFMFTNVTHKVKFD
jgi:hypothetical protein